MNTKGIMIGNYPEEVPIGTRFEWFFDVNRNIINQPCVVIRRATKEEFIEYYESENGNNHPPASCLDGYYFYEVSTD